MPWPTSERTTLSPASSTVAWTACDTSPSRLPGLHCSTASNSDCFVTSSSLDAIGVTGPTGNVRAASATQPSLITPTSMLMMSPRCELVGAGDPVDDHRVGRRADRAREAAVALERRLGALRADELLGRLVEVLRGHALADLALEQLQRADQDRPGRGHLVDLLGRLLDDHSSSSRRSVAIVARMWSWTSVGERRPSKRLRTPRSS